MTREEAIQVLKKTIAYESDFAEAKRMAIEALERENEYGQMVVDFTKGETMKPDEWKYDTTCDAESATTTDCISRIDAIKVVIEALKEYVGDGVIKCADGLRSLPPAEPIRCGECKHQDYCYQTVSYTKVRPGCSEHSANPIEWCSRAERKEE